MIISILICFLLLLLPSSTVATKSQLDKDIKEISTNFVFDDDSNLGTSIEFTHSLVLINYSISYDYWIENNLFDKNHEFSFLLGLGVTNYFQLQGGFSTLGIGKIRIKSTLNPWPEENPFKGLEKEWWHNTGFTFLVGKNFGAFENYKFEIGISYIFYSGEPLFRL